MSPELDHKRIEQELFEANQRLTTLMSALPVGVTFSLDTNCENIALNPYMERMMEMEPGAGLSATSRTVRAQGKPLRHFMNGQEVKAHDLTMQRAIRENKEVGPFEIEVELPSGKRWIMEARGAPIHDKNGVIIGAIAVNVDLTERKKAEASEKLALHFEEEKVRMNFIADAAHELRTPLAIIKGNIDLVLHTKAAPEGVLEAIDVEVVHLTNLLSDLSLLTTKENQMKKNILTRKVDLTDLISRVVKRHETYAKKRKINLHLEKIPEIEMTGDEYYLERLFSNIISNAVAYGKEGGDVWVSGVKDSKHILLEIRDNGAGISEKDLPHIFERFYRAEASRSKDFGGSGLGLSIVEWIAKAHGGRVAATSVEGEGSTFTVTFPVGTRRN